MKPRGSRYFEEMSAVGDAHNIDILLGNDMPCQFAFTITPSPYKKFPKLYGENPSQVMVRYKDMCLEDQKDTILFILASLHIDYESINFEKTKAGDIHAHATSQFITEDEALYESRQLAKSIGYSGKSNKDEHFCFVKRIFNKSGWHAYQIKDYDWTDTLYNNNGLPSNKWDRILESIQA